MDTVHECDRQTDGQTDGPTDRITITNTVQRIASHGKNVSACFWNTVNFIGFSVVRVSQGSVATYVRYGGMPI